jgi:hypothetical protein
MIKQKQKTVSHHIHIKKPSSYYSEKVGNVCYLFSRNEREKFFADYALSFLFLLAYSYIKEHFRVSSNDTSNIRKDMEKINGIIEEYKIEATNSL